MPNRREIYSEAEVGKIMRRAVELQETTENQQYTPGVTREELERIAGEMGISVFALEKALAEVQKQEPEKRSWFTLKTEIEKVIDGELDPNDFDLVSAQLPQGNSQMQPAQVGRTLTARVQAGLGTAQVTVTSRGGRTKVKVDSFPVMPLVFGFQSAMFASIFGPLLISKGLFGAGVTVLAGLVGLSSWFLTGGMKSARRSAENLADKLTGAVLETLEDGKSSRVREQLDNAHPISESDNLEKEVTDAG
jgi:uncharacterized protein (DUF2267 family)